MLRSLWIKLKAEAFSRVLWSSIKGDGVPYPTQRDRTDLRQNRELLLYSDKKNT
ncbi:hypothetical protein [Scytonema hofmannii]|uniref:hypothetical protein n=1 Tax=Scytonema hofmannii TaxID=34078 RepID=UPI0003449DFD|nr:hypothetical protein [Scytonema hofmannii]